MKKIKYDAKQETIDLIKKYYKSCKKEFAPTRFTLFDGTSIDLAPFNQIEIDTENLLFSYLSLSNQFIFEAIFYSSFDYETGTFKERFDNFLLEIFEKNKGKPENIILQSEYNEKEKIILSFVCSNYTNYYTQFIKLFKQAESIFIKEYQSDYNSILQKFNNFDLGSIFLSEIVRKSKHFITCITDYRNIRFHQESNTILYGIVNLVDKKENTDNYIETLKILCDSTKYSILKELAIKSCYQRELAIKLGLTTATIAHHISILLEKDIIHSKLIKNKVFFTLNYEKIDLAIQIFKSGIFIKNTIKD